MSVPVIVYQDEDLFVIDKPEGQFVHPPENTKYPVPDEKIALRVLRDHFRRPVFPVHRLDAPTSGLVVFTFDKFVTRELSTLFRERQVEKTYEAVVRGYTNPSGTIDIPLPIKGFEQLNECETSYETLARREFEVAVGKRYPTARYSFVRVSPTTGRWHQIRRHFDRIGHPLLGDIEHGDSHHNRYFRDSLGMKGLCLRAVELKFQPPWMQTPLCIRAGENPKWQGLREIFRLPPRD